MRPIKFRGLINEKNEERRWVYGFLNFEEYDDGEYSFPSIMYYDDEVGWYSNIVDEKSVGQFTGAEDGFGNEIYEGDIIKDRRDRVFEVEWDDFHYQFVLRNQEGVIRYTLGHFINELYGCEVIGNIFEKGGEK